MFIELLASVSMVVTASVLDAHEIAPGRRQMAHEQRLRDAAGAEADRLRSSVPAMSHVTSAASRQAAT